MNFLAHIYFSGNDPMVRLGNFIADSIKGNKHQLYPAEVAKGILIHREIDSYFDSHPLVLNGKTRLQEKYGRYSGIVVDMYYDHFLALCWSDYSDKNFKAFTRSFYLSLVLNLDILPARFRFITPYLIARDWFTSYKTVEGIESVLKRLSRRTSLPDHSEFAGTILKKYYSEYESEFRELMPQMQDHLKKRWPELF